MFVSASAALFVGRQNKSWKGAAFTKVIAAPFENSAYDEARHAAGSLEAGGAAGVTGFVAAGAAAFLLRRPQLQPPVSHRLQRRRLARSCDNSR